MARLTLADEVAVVREICRAQGLGETAPTILKAAHHTSLLIGPEMIVARVQSSEPVDEAREHALRECAVATHLARHGAPALAPLKGALAGPHVVPPAVVTLWPYAKGACSAEEEDASLAATTLDAIHRGLADYGGALPSYTEMLDRCWKVLADDEASAALGPADRDLLRARYRHLRREIARDAGPRWIDFEDACRGPREWDIACLPSAAWPLFADSDRALIGRCSDLRSVCGAVWCWADVAHGPEVAEAAAYHLDRVRRRASGSLSA